MLVQRSHKQIQALAIIKHGTWSVVQFRTEACATRSFEEGYTFTMSKDEGEISSSLYTMHLPPLIPINSMEANDSRKDVQARIVSKFSIDCILSKTNPNNELKNCSTQCDTVEKKQVPNYGSTGMSDARENLKIPSYTCMIAQAILSSRDRKITLGEIYEYIERTYPAIEHKVKGWRNCVRHNLSLNDCFLKIGPSGHGRGNNWTVHPSYVDSFLRGHFRKRIAGRRRKCQTTDMPNWREPQHYGAEFYSHPILSYQQKYPMSKRYFEFIPPGIDIEHHCCRRLAENSVAPHMRMPGMPCSYGTSNEHGNRNGFPIAASESFHLIDTVSSQKLCSKYKMTLGSTQQSMFYREGDKICKKGKTYEEQTDRVDHSPSMIGAPATSNEKTNISSMEMNYLIHFPMRGITAFEQGNNTIPKCIQQNKRNKIYYK